MARKPVADSGIMLDTKTATSWQTRHTEDGIETIETLWLTHEGQWVWERSERRRPIVAGPAPQETLRTYDRRAAAAWFLTHEVTMHESLQDMQSESRAARRRRRRSARAARDSNER